MSGNSLQTKKRDSLAQLRVRAEREMNAAFAQAVVETGALPGQQMTRDEMRDLAQHIRANRALRTRFYVAGQLIERRKKRKPSTLTEKIANLLADTSEDQFIFLDSQEVRREALARMRGPLAGPDGADNAAFFRSRRALLRDEPSQ